MHPPVWGQHDSVLTTHLVLLAYFQANLASELHLHVSFFRSDLSWSVISCSLMECPFLVVLKAVLKDSSNAKVTFGLDTYNCFTIWLWRDWLRCLFSRNSLCFQGSSVRFP